MVLECRVRGSKPSITWTKDNDFIESNDKYQQFDQADGYCKLIINNPAEKDSGQYVCKAGKGRGLFYCYYYDSLIIWLR